MRTWSAWPARAVVFRVGLLLEADVHAASESARKRRARGFEGLIVTCCFLIGTRRGWSRCDASLELLAERRSSCSRRVFLAIVDLPVVAIALSRCAGPDVSAPSVSANSDGSLSNRPHVRLMRPWRVRKWARSSSLGECAGAHRVVHVLAADLAQPAADRRALDASVEQHVDVAAVDVPCARSALTSASRSTTGRTKMAGSKPMSNGGLGVVCAASRIAVRRRRPRCRAPRCRGDHQLRLVGAARAVGHGVGEDVVSTWPDAGRRQHVGVGEVDAVGVAAVGLDHQRAVAARQRLADGAGSAAAGLRAGADRGDLAALAAVHVACRWAARCPWRAVPTTWSVAMLLSSTRHRVVVGAVDARSPARAVDVAPAVSRMR